jgi:hypothetical protein
MLFWSFLEYLGRFDDSMTIFFFFIILVVLWVFWSFWRFFFVIWYFWGILVIFEPLDVF